MNFWKKLCLALSFVAVASAFRFTSMNSTVDLVTTTLIVMSLVCGFRASLIGWTLFGIILEISYLVQGGFTLVFPGILTSFAICILTCATIGLTVSLFVKFSGKNALVLSPAFVFLAKWLLAFGQDAWLLVFNPSMASVWWSYHTLTEIWALSKIAQAILWYIPVYAIMLGYVFVKKHIAKKSDVGATTEA